MSMIDEQKVRSETIRVRRAAERGHARYDWLDTWRTLSFDNYYDPAHMGFRVLQVINEDRVEPGKGFGMHGHRDARVYLSTLDADQEVRHRLQPGRHAWLQVLRGAVQLNGQVLRTSDAAAVSGETAVSIPAREISEIMLFDLT